MKKLIFINCFILASIFLKAQNQIGYVPGYTPNGYFDTLYDHLGNKYPTKNLLVNPGPNPDPEQIAATSVSCTAGYFRLYFAINSGFDGNTQIEIDRRAVLCQLFTDLSCLLISPLSSPCNTTTNTITFVNVHIDNDPGGFAAAAPLFAAPGNAAVGASLVDCMAYKTIISGVDGYTNVNTPILTTGGNNFYHLLMKFNTSVNWYNNLTSTAIALNQFDLYTIGLHEALHGLGFVSLMGSTGSSVYAPLQNIYSKYDLRLRAGQLPALTPVLSSTNAQCALANLQLNVPTNSVNPGNCVSSSSSDNTNSLTMCYYVSSSTSMTVAVYTPTCFESGSSWSHFEDQWYPLGGPFYGNNQYFVMSNAYGGPNVGIKRYPREEEKIVLCDLGYSVASQYVSPVAGAPFTYTSGACQGPGVWGINDGIVNTAYIYTATAGVVNISTLSVKANDSPNTSQIDCVSLVYNYPNISLSVVGGSVQITQTGPVLYCGVVLAQYIPRTLAGIPGNITYIYTYFPCGNCGANLCDYVQNGGFENIPAANSSTGSCLRDWNIPNTPICWANHSNGTPDVYNMSAPCNTAIPQSYLGNVTVNSLFNISSTYNGLPNNRIAGMIGRYNVSSSAAYYVEVIKNDLSALVVPSQTYILSFWAFNSKGLYNPLGLPTVITFATRQSITSTNGATYPSAGDNVVASFTLPASDINTWKQYTTTIVFNNTVTPGQNAKCLIVGPNPNGTAAANPSAPTNTTYTFIDDVSLLNIQNALLFGPPSIVCNNTCLNQLSQYANQPNVVFSGPFVFPNAGDYDFCPTTPGNYTVVASYTNNVGCSYTTQAVIAVPGLSITPSSTLFCNYLNYTLTAVAIPTNIASPFPLWQPQNINASSVVVPGNNPTVYTAFASISGCPVSALFTPTIVPNTIITSTPDIWCATPNAAFTMSVSLPNFNLPIIVTQTWSPPISSTLNPVSVSFSNVINPIYTVITSAGGCTNLATYTATWLTTPTIAIVGGTNCLTPNQTVTLQAISISTLPITYTWQPGNANTSSIVITPTAITIYSLITSYSNCAFSNTIGIYPAPQFTNVPASICSGQVFSFLQNLLAPGTPITGTFSGVGVFGPQTLTSFSVPTTSAPGPYSVIYSYLTPAGCFATNTLVLNVTQGVSLSIPNPTVTYCPNIAVGASVIAIATPSAFVTYTWMPGNINTPSFVATPTANTSYTLIASIGSCSAIGRAYVVVNNSCCASANYINVSSLTNQTLTGLYAINQDITIFGSVVLGGEFLIAPNVSITVSPGATLTSNQGSGGTIGNPLHLRACTNLWRGIYVQNGGKVLLWQGDLVEDGREAIVSDGCTTTSGIDISLLEVAFNRNNISVAIRNYNQTTNTPPFNIEKCVFTCRNLNIPFYSLTWPSAQTLKAASGPTNTLASPYLFAPFTPTNLMPPLNTRPSMNGILVENSGLTANPTATAPTYFAININNDNTANSTNYFDNLIIGISARNSNVNSYNNIFQNTRRWQPLPNPNILLYGIGIYTFNDNTHFNTNCRLNMVTTSSATTLFNIFYNCHFGIYGTNLYELNCRFQDFRSTQNNTLPFNNNVRGQFAIYNVSNRFKRYEISNNVFQNIRTCIYNGAIQGALNIPSIPAFGLYLGNITISDNLFSPTIGTVAPTGTGFVNLGVYLGGPLGPSTNTANTFYIPGSSIRVTTNNFSRVYRAVHCNGFSNSIYNTINANNRITMIPDVIAPLASQFGIEHMGNINDIVNTNTIIGTAITLSQTRVTGIYKSMNSNSSIQCNSVVSVYNGFQFASNNSGAFWQSNLINANRQGLFLSNNGIISQQGSVNSPQDNVWQNPAWWTGTNFNTFTQGSMASNSMIFRRTIATYSPTNNFGVPLLFSYFVVSNLPNANNSAPIFNCFPAPPCPNCNPSFVSSLMDIATSNITYIDNIAQAEEINMDLTYRDIEVEPAVTYISSILSTFYMVNSGAIRGAFKDVRNNISAGNHTTAGSILVSINPVTNIENNTKVFYFLYNTYIGTGSLTPAQNILLNILAHQCPFSDGPVVYQARSLYSIVNEDASLYTDVGCVERGYSYGKAADTATTDQLEVQLMQNEKLSNEKFKPVTAYGIFPNPAENSVNIMSTRAREILQVQIVDVNGKILLNTTMIISDHKAELNFNLLNGIYFVNLINEQGEKTVKKLVIAKD